MKTIGKAIIFCGLPATLKTYLSIRLAGRIGFAYIPTQAIGDIAAKTSAKTLYKARLSRYGDLAELVNSALKLGANLVVDGGFPTLEARKIILDKANPRDSIIVHCIADVSTRIERLEQRDLDNIDYENYGAKYILQDLRDEVKLTQEESPEIELKNGKIRALLVIDTTNFKMEWKGEPPKDLVDKITAIIQVLFDEYKRNKISACENEIIEHFNDFAYDYDNTTEWRNNKEILESLQTNSIPFPSRILDIGAGTGLASEWYSKNGHSVVGIDISPKMLQKASDRLNLVVLGNGTKLPFIDNYFDLVIIRQCLHYVNPTQLLKESFRVLKKGKLIVVSSVVCTNVETKHFWAEFKNATQPLRLDVFTSNDIKDLLDGSGYNIVDEKKFSLIRKEKIDSIEKRSRDIPGGLFLFLKNMEKLTSNLFPELEFKILDDRLEYRQYWTTIWAEK